jgi:hypothetical protein
LAFVFLCLHPFEDLFAHDVGVEDLHGLNALFVGELPRYLCALLSLLLGRLHRDELIAVLLDDCLDITAVWGSLLKLLVQTELQLHGLERGAGLNEPVAVGLGNLKEKRNLVLLKLWLRVVFDFLSCKGVAGISD